MLPVFAVAALLQASDPAPPASPTAPVEVTGAKAPTGSKRSARKSAATPGKIASTDPAAPASSPTPAPAPTPDPVAATAATAASSAAAAVAAKAEENDLLVRQKCGKCHDVSLAFSAQLTDAHWKAHMKRMARVPGAAITEEQAKRVHAHLKAVAGRR
jgi:hypothetical protein